MLPIRRLCPVLALVLAFVPTLRAPARERSEDWLEVRSPHFVVVSNSSEKQARRVADRFERIRSIFHETFPRLRVDPNAPIVALAVKDEKTLKTLLPEYWEQSGRIHPAGFFVRGPEKNYVALQLDAEGESPYHTIYHEYVHLLVDQNAASIPLWLNEGLAEFYGYTEIREKEVWLGQPSSSHVLLLRENKLLPLETLFAVDHSSPYYNEQNKASIFYAESWALTHYLLFKGYQGNQNELGEFLTLLGQGVETNAAATRAFGDLKKLGKDLEAYVRQSSYSFLRKKGATDVDDDEFRARQLPAAESAAVRGDFLVHNGRYAEAKVFLEEALRLDPRNAPAHESMGFLEFQQGHQEEARKWFTEVVKLDSRSYLAHYYFAVMTMQAGLDADASARIESSLRSAIKINPAFAPAYDALATFYGRRGERLDEAYLLSLQALRLEPSNARYFLNRAAILLRMNRPDDAVRVAERAGDLAKSTEDRAAALAVLDGARRHQQYAAAQKQAADQELAAQPARPPLEPKGAVRRGTRPDDNPAPPVLRHRDESRESRDLVEGKVSLVKCSPPTAMDLTLETSHGTLQFHTDNYFNVEFGALDFTPTDELLPCQQLQGRTARVVFIGYRNQPKAGKIASIFLKK